MSGKPTIKISDPLIVEPVVVDPLIVEIADPLIGRRDKRRGLGRHLMQCRSQQPSHSPHPRAPRSRSIRRCWPRSAETTDRKSVV